MPPRDSLYQNGARVGVCPTDIADGANYDVAVAVCSHCHQLIQDDQIVCPHCYTPARPTAPLNRRPGGMVALVVLVAALAVLLWVLTHHLRW